MSTIRDLVQYRDDIDAIDAGILDLLVQRTRIVEEVAEHKHALGMPVYVPEREAEKSARFREQAEHLGMDGEWAEDFLRLIMAASRQAQSQAGRFPSATPEPRTVLIVGGAGRMGRLYGHMLGASGHRVRILDRDDWSRLDERSRDVDLVLVTVPIDQTETVIERLAGHLPAEAVLADLTSHKAGPLQAMLAAHPGPVVGLHPMHGPDIPGLSRQLLICCPGRKAEQADWFLAQARLWGMRIQTSTAREHDRAMDLVQGLRHFVAFLHGSFMRRHQLEPDRVLECSSPVYRAELMMTGRIFAQDSALYADIVFGSEDRRRLLLDFLGHHQRLAEIVEAGDREAFIREFESIRAFFGDFSETALVESGYLISRLADRFA